MTVDDIAAIKAFVETLDDLTDRQKGNLTRKLVEEFREIKEMYPSVEDYVYEISQPGGLDDYLGP